jgi:uncharacterized protein (TIGR03437 family)
VSPRLLLALLTLPLLAPAQTSGFLLGVDYSEWLPGNVTKIVTDSTGAIYLLSSTAPITAQTSPSKVTKLSADGKSVIWQNQLTVPVSDMAVDPQGGVYVAPVVIQAGFTGYPVTIAKLNPTGSGVLWQQAVSIPGTSDFTPVVGVDSTGRSYIATSDANGIAQIARVDAAGAAIDFRLTLFGPPTSITASAATGAAFVAGIGGQGVYVTKLNPDGSSAFTTPYAVFPIVRPVVSLDPNGDIVLNEGGKFQRFDSTGKLVAAADHSGWAYHSPTQGALDLNGNLYIAGGTNGLYPVKNTIATCGIEMFGVFGRDGSVIQTSYVPGLQSVSAEPLLTVAPDSSLYLVVYPSSGFTASRTGPFPAASGGAGPVLIHLTQSPGTQTYALACAGNAASFLAQPIAPGEIVTLFGNGLGPPTGVQTQASFQQPFPKTAGNVTVTFDGAAAPILYAQDAQINVTAPWALNPGTSTQICVTYNSAPTNCLTWAVAQTSPGVFTVDGYHAAALNQDGTVNSATNPAAVGSVVSIFMTGLGPISPGQQDGALVVAPYPTNVYGTEVDMPADGPPTSGIQWIALTESYSGPAPNLIAGATQINFQLGFTAGKTVKSVVTGMRSQAFDLYLK